MKKSMDCYFSDFWFQDLLRSFFPVFERKNKFTSKTLPIEHVFLWSAHWANAKKCKICLISFRRNSFFSERKASIQCSESESTWKLYLKTSIPLNMLPTSSLHQNFAEPEMLESAVSFEKNPVLNLFYSSKLLALYSIKLSFNKFKTVNILQIKHHRRFSWSRNAESP